MTGEFENVEVQPFTGLAVQFVREAGARIMLRGLRTLSDMEYEFTMSLMNLNLDPGIETVFLMAKEEFSHVSSSLLRQIAALGGDLSKFLPEPVKEALIAKGRNEDSQYRHRPVPSVLRLRLPAHSRPVRPPFSREFRPCRKSPSRHR